MLVLGEREAIRWVLLNEQMAFPATPRPEVSALRVGDELVLLTTRSAYHNPTRDRTRIIGTATVLSKVAQANPPVEIAGRIFMSTCKIRVETLVPCLSGPEVGPLVPRIEALRGHTNWGMQLRRPLVPLTASDVTLLEGELQGHLGDYNRALESYSKRIKTAP